VAIARALAGQPDIVFADEPTASLDAESGRKTVELLRGLAKDRKTTVVVVTHDSRILGYADRVVQLEDGKIGQTTLNQVSSPV
jgi:putative ABC transport system ATP-binding protein